jgi:ribonuclease HI
MRLVANIDGGRDSRSGEIYIGALIVDVATGKVIKEHSAAMGTGTHNEAEYQGLLYALRFAIEHGAQALRVLSDSRLIVNQVNGQWRIYQDHLRAYHAQASELIQQLPAFEIEWIPRKENSIADTLTRSLRP